MYFSYLKTISIVSPAPIYNKIKFQEKSNISKISTSFRQNLKIKQEVGKYNLQGIIYDDDSPIAIINGKKITQGETIAGAELINVSQKGINLETEGKIIYIPLD